MYKIVEHTDESIVLDKDGRLCSIPMPCVFAYYNQIKYFGMVGAVEHLLSQNACGPMYFQKMFSSGSDEIDRKECSEFLNALVGANQQQCCVSVEKSELKRLPRAVDVFLRAAVTRTYQRTVGGSMRKLHESWAYKESTWRRYCDTGEMIQRFLASYQDREFFSATLKPMESLNIGASPLSSMQLRRLPKISEFRFPSQLMVISDMRDKSQQLVALAHPEVLAPLSTAELRRRVTLLNKGVLTWDQFLTGVVKDRRSDGHGGSETNEDHGDDFASEGDDGSGDDSRTNDTGPESDSPFEFGNHVEDSAENAKNGTMSVNELEAINAGRRLFTYMVNLRKLIEGKKVTDKHAARLAIENILHGSLHISNECYWGLRKLLGNDNFYEEFEGLDEV